MCVCSYGCMRVRAYVCMRVCIELCTRDTSYMIYIYLWCI